MTLPTPPLPPIPDIPIPIAPKKNVLKLEQQAVQQVTGALREQVQRASQQILALYVTLAGGVQNPMPDHLRGRFKRGAADIIARVTFGGQETLWELVWRALAMGEQAAASIAPADLAPTRPAVEQWIQQMTGTLAARIRAILTGAAAWAGISEPGTEKDVAAILGQVGQAVTLAERDVRWSINAAYNQGVRSGTDAAGVRRMWVAEVDACLHCLAYSGEIAEPGQPYRAGLTYYVGPEGSLKPLRQPAGLLLWGPPLHPNCRCDQEPYLGSEGYPVMPWERDETSVAAALKREARRSVLRGESGSDSTPALVRAADALLAIGSGLPKSVEARARAAVRAGRFK